MNGYKEWHRPEMTEKWLTSMEGIFTGSLPEFPSDDMGVRIDSFFKANGVGAQVIGTEKGPVVSTYIVELTKETEHISRIENLRRDLGLRLGVGSAKVFIGESLWKGMVHLAIEVPNLTRVAVPSGVVVPVGGGKGLSVCLGVDTTGKPYAIDVAKAPHILVAGQSGSGKSVFLNSLICGVITNYCPGEARVIIVDPKGTEFNSFSGHPSIGATEWNGKYSDNVPYGTDDAVYIVNRMVRAMKFRMAFFRHIGVNNLDACNEYIRNSCDEIEFAYENDLYRISNLFPRVIVVIDEFYDLMVSFGNAFEEPLSVLAAKARSAGIHLVLATQRPSADVVKGALKANLSTRVALKVASRTDSQVILDRGGAETLCGRGDMLYVGPDGDVPTRLHGCMLTDDEIRECVRRGKELVDSLWVETVETYLYH